MAKTNLFTALPNDMMPSNFFASTMKTDTRIIKVGIDGDIVFEDFATASEPQPLPEMIESQEPIYTNLENMVTAPVDEEWPIFPDDVDDYDYPDDFYDYCSDKIRTILHECPTCYGIFISDTEYETHSCQINFQNNIQTFDPNILLTDPVPNDFIPDTATNTVELPEKSSELKNEVEHMKLDVNEPKEIEINEQTKLLINKPKKPGINKSKKARVKKQKKPGVHQAKKPGVNVMRKHLRKPMNIKVKKIEISKEKMSVRTRNDHGSHMCHICKKSLSRRSSLTIHMRRHTGEMPFECDYCEKKFVVLYDLDRHMLIHVGEKKYSCYCDVCRKPFVSKSGMIQHKRINHGSFTIHPCDVCGLTFSRKSKLLTHKISHQSEKVMLNILNANSTNVQLLLLYDNYT